MCPDASNPGSDKDAEQLDSEEEISSQSTDSTGTPSNSTDTITLAMSLDAATNLTNPKAVEEDIRLWTNSFGLLTDGPLLDIIELRREHDLSLDFHSGHRDIETALSELHETHSTDRFIFVSSNPDHEAHTSDTEWEFLTLEEAADQAEWEL